MDLFIAVLILLTIVALAHLNLLIPLLCIVVFVLAAFTLADFIGCIRRGD